jgi:hypothetical protein
MNSAKDEKFGTIPLPSREMRLLGSFAALHERLKELEQIHNDNKISIEKRILFQIRKSLNVFTTNKKMCIPNKQKKLKKQLVLIWVINVKLSMDIKSEKLEK